MKLEFADITLLNQHYGKGNINTGFRDIPLVGHKTNIWYSYYIGALMLLMNIDAVSEISCLG